MRSLNLSIGAAALTLLSVFYPAQFHPAQAEVFGAKKTVLDNGMQVVVVENHRAPVVTHMVWYRVGAMDEPPGKSGIAHFLEHLMFKGTETLEPGEFSAIIARNGGQENAFTSQDFTAYFQSVASDRLELVMELEADRMANLNIAEDHFEPEKNVVLEERRQRVDSDPASILWEQTAPSIYRNHPYAIPVIGWSHEIEALQLEDAIDFYQTYYAPNNAILVVSGDVEASEVFAMAEKFYGVLEPSRIPVGPVYREPPMTVDTEVTYRDPRVRQASVSVRKLAPSWNTAEDKSEIHALDVLSQIIGGGNTSKLYRALVIDRGVAVGAGGWYDGDGRGPGTIGFFVSPADGTSLEEAEAALREEIAKLIKKGVTKSEVQRAIVRLQDAAATARDSLSGPAMTIGRALATGKTLDDVERWPERIGAVTTDQVNAVARKYLSMPGEVVSRLLPADGSKGAGQ